MEGFWDWGLPFEKEEERPRIPERTRPEVEEERAFQREEPEREHWAEEKKGIWDYEFPEERVDPATDRLVWGWVKKNPHHIIDILTGMYGMTGNDSGRQERLRTALDAARDVLEVFPSRTAQDEIGRKMQSIGGAKKNFENFKQALLAALPNLISAERSRKALDKADALIYVADRIYDL